MMKKLAINCSVILLLLFSLCVFCSLASASEGEPLKNYKQIPIQQWEILKQNHLSLQSKLEEAKFQTIRLKSMSKELVLKLETAENLLTQSRQELSNSNASLTKVKDLLEQTRKSLNQLTSQIDEEREQEKKLRRRLELQRNLAWVLAGMLLIVK